MKKIMYLVLFVAVSACATAEVNRAGKENSRPVKEVSVNKGTNTAVVKVSLDENGIPSIDTDPVIVKEGQRVVWVGPAEMTIKFPKGTPFSKSKLPTRDAVINMKIPKQKKWAKDEEFKEFKYDVIVGKHILDPVFIVKTGF